MTSRKHSFQIENLEKVLRQKERKILDLQERVAMMIKQTTPLVRSTSLRRRQSRQLSADVTTASARSVSIAAKNSVYDKDLSENHMNGVDEKKTTQFVYFSSTQ